MFCINLEDSKPDSLTTVYNWGNNEIKKIDAKKKKKEKFLFLSWKYWYIIRYS